MPYTNVIPTMTSNTAPSGVASVSASHASYPAWKAFDDVLTDGWVLDTFTGTAWLQYQFPTAKKISKYTLMPQTGALTRSPKTFSFKGSNDGSSWVTLDTRTNETGWATSTKREYTFSNSTAYTHYRLDITANDGAGAWVSVAEMEMMELINNKTLVFHSGMYKKYASNVWENVSSSPTEADYLGGMDDISTIPQSAWQQLTGAVELCYYTDDSTKTEAQFSIETTPFTLAEEWEDQIIQIIEYTDNASQTESAVTTETEVFTLYDEFGSSVDVLYYTDDATKSSASVDITANYTPLDEIDGDFEVVAWTDNESIVVGNEPSLTYEALPFEQLIVHPTDINSYGTIKSLIASKIPQTVEGTLRFIVSFDSGLTWKTYKFDKWRTISIADKSIIKKQGISIEVLNTIPESYLVGVNKVGYYLDNSIHNSAENVQLDYLKVVSSAPTNDVKFDNLAFYLLNTTATIQVSLRGNKIVGTLDDVDAGKVQYRVILNNTPYYPSSGDFSPLLPSPLNIQLNLSESNIVFGQENTLRVEFQDYWGQTDFWETTFIGTYSGIMFKDESGNYYSNSLGEILKHLDFGDLIAGQTTLEQKVIAKNQLGVQLQNLILEVQKENLPEGVTIELSRSNFPFSPEDPLLFNMFFNENDEFEFFVRIVTQLTATATPNGQFEIRAKADPV